MTNKQQNNLAIWQPLLLLFIVVGGACWVLGYTASSTKENQYPERWQAQFVKTKKLEKESQQKISLGKELLAKAKKDLEATSDEKCYDTRKQEILYLEARISYYQSTLKLIKRVYTKLDYMNTKRLMGEKASNDHKEVEKLLHEIESHLNDSTPSKINKKIESAITCARAEEKPRPRHQAKQQIRRKLNPIPSKKLYYCLFEKRSLEGLSYSDDPIKREKNEKIQKAIARVYPGASKSGPDLTQDELESIYWKCIHPMPTDRIGIELNWFQGE
jgi:hypothetical protein